MTRATIAILISVGVTCFTGGVALVNGKDPTLSALLWGYALCVAGLGAVAAPPIVRFWKSPKVRVFHRDGEGREFVLALFGETCGTGGSVFSTYLLEGTEGSDVTADILKTESEKATTSRSVEWDRLVMIDDPTQEERWITSFLSLRTEPSSRASLAIKPCVWAVLSPSRPVVRLLRAVLLRASLTLIAKNGSRSQKISYISLSETTSLEGVALESNFAVAIRSSTIHDHLRSFVSRLREENHDHIRILRTPEDYHRTTLRPPDNPLSLRLVSAIEECAISNVNIRHVGVFGSVATIHGQGKGGEASERRPWSENSDLDLLVVMSKGARREDVKRGIEKALRDQALDDSGEQVEIEWSSERPTFYFFRHDFHVDIQLHVQGDDYYVTETRLLGHAVFGSPYHVIYADQNLPVDSFIGVPNEVLGRSERARLFLGDPLGLEAFVDECSRGDQRIDPRRVVAINAANLVWTLTGMWPPRVDEAMEFLEEDSARQDLGLSLTEHQDMIAGLKNILDCEVAEGAPALQQECLRRVLSALEGIQNVVGSMC